MQQDHSIHSSKHKIVRPYWQETVKGGFRRLSVHHIAMLWWLYQQGHITARQLRIVFAYHEMAERRCNLADDGYRVYGLAELRKLIGVGKEGPTTDSSLRSDLRRLCRLHILDTDQNNIRFATSIDQLCCSLDTTSFWSFFEALPHSRRTVPVPRRLLRGLAGGFTRAVTGTILAYLIRCLFWHKEQAAFRTDGRIKASWIADTFGLSRRSVIAARQRLTELGWLAALPVSQWELNRWGGRYVVNTAWHANENLSEKTNSAPPPCQNHANSAPLYKQDSSSNEEIINKKPASGRPSGVSIREGEKNEEPPRVSNIQPEDLRDFSRSQALYQIACRKHQAHSSDHGRLEFFALIERARTRGQDPCRLFAWLIRHQRFDFISQSDEDAASQRIKRHEYDSESVAERRNTYSRGTVITPVSAPPEDVTKYIAVLRAVGQTKSRLTPSEAAQAHLQWSQDRWEAAESDYLTWQQAKAEAVGGSPDWGLLV